MPTLSAVSMARPHRVLAGASHVVIVAALAGTTMPAFAQSAPAPTVAAIPAGDAADIVVTARKRDETLISVPVVVSAVSGVTLQNRGITNLDGLARVVPQLLIGPQSGSVQGGNIAIRGISGPDSNPFGDSAVSFNIDGVQVAKATVRRMSDIDLAQVEVLKGPQALFFGKNSPAGIVSIRTADPTDHFEVGAKVGYETYAHEIRTEDYVSGPLTDTLGFRLAGYYSNMRGWLKEQTPDDSPVANDHDHNPWSHDYALRGTLKWSPSERFDAKLKLNYAHTINAGPAATVETFVCPTGARQTGSGAECTLGDRNVNAASGTFIGTLPGTITRFGDGENFLRQKQFLGSLQANYHLSDTLTATSVTGYYYAKVAECQNYQNDFVIILPSCNPYSDKEFSQELRVASNYDGPLNFTAGGYVSSTRSFVGNTSYIYGNGFDLLGPGFGGPTTPALLSSYILKQRGTAYSGYLQMAYKPIPVIEIDIGGRYSYEKKSLPLVKNGGGLGQTLATAILDDSTIIQPVKDHASWHDFSPEMTVSYRPSQNLTLFGSYKHGFLSGGFNSSSVNFQANPDLSYNQQTVKGFEAGVKSALFDHALYVNLAAYTYKITGLQVTNFTNTTSTIRNAGAATAKGIEADFNYRTPLRGLSVHGAAAFNRGRYTSFPEAPCYNGQTPAEGCTIGATGNATQNLSHSELVRSPKWNLSGGFLFERPVGTGLKAGLSGDVTYSSSFLTDATSDPSGRMPHYALVDATLRLGKADDGWQMAVIGRNLTNRFYFVASTNVPFTGGGTGTAAGQLGDRYASVSRGREVMLQLSAKFR